MALTLFEIINLGVLRLATLNISIAAKGSIYSYTDVTTGLIMSNTL